LPSKKAVVTAAAPKEALQGIAFLHGMWTDNGGEFEAEFDRELEARGIMHVRTTPRNLGKTGKWNVSGRQSSKLNQKT
jgi:hypothetical protein